MTAAIGLDGKQPPGLSAREVAGLNQRFAGRSSPEVLAWAWERFGNRAAIGTSYQGAGLVMMHLAKMAGLTFPVFTLDTGLLFPETLALKQRLEDFYGLKIEALEPDLTVAGAGGCSRPGIVEARPGPVLHGAQSAALARQIGGTGLLADRAAAATIAGAGCG